MAGVTESMLEVDFIVDRGNRRLALIEAKATRTPMPDDARALSRLAGSVADYRASLWVAHAGEGARAAPSPLSAGVKAVGVERIAACLEA
jgi:hypothetical protein